MLGFIIGIGLSMKSQHYLKDAMISTLLLICGLFLAVFGGIIILFSWEILEVSVLKWVGLLSGMVLVFVGVIALIFSQYFPRKK
jgi:hypothetical protein